MKTYLKDMTQAQMKHLLEANDNFWKLIRDNADEDAGWILEDYLRDIPAEYDISGYDYSYVDIKSDNYNGVYCYDSFEDWFNTTQEDYGLVSPEEEETIRAFLKYAKIANKLMYDVVCKEKDFDNVVEKFESLKHDTEFILMYRFKSEYTAYDNLDTLANYAEWYVSEYCENQFITDNSYNHIYEHVNGHYVAAHDAEIM